MLSLRLSIKTLLLFVFSLSSAWADTGLEHFLLRLDSLKNLEANFVQTTRDSRGVSLQELAGKLTVAKPGKMRWHTDPPFEQLVVADGKDVWVYDKDLEQVTIRKLEQRVADTPALLLSGNSAAIGKDFDVSETQKGDIARYTLIPKDKSQLFERIEFQYGADVLESMRIFDAAGQTTDIVFSQVKINTSIASKSFVFTPPKGVDVIDGRNAH